MAIITISRGSLSGGTRFARCLGKTLGYRVISREELVAEAARLYGVDENLFHRGLTRGPSLLERFRIDRVIYLAVAKATLCRMVQDDHVVYHGHAGQFLLDGVNYVFRLRIIAPMEFRVAAAREEHGLSEEEAIAFIEARDAERRSWTRFLYGIEWGDPSLYDLVINMEKVSFEAACHMVEAAVAQGELIPSEQDIQRLHDLFLQAHVAASLFLNPKIAAAAAGIQVVASDGNVQLKGVMPGERYVAEAVTTCQALPEVRSVNAEWLGCRGERV